MARFFYTFKTSDGRRRVAEIESGSRDEAFAELRRQGIRPIKVVAEDGSRENGASRPAASAWWGFALAAAIAALVAGAWWIGGGGRFRHRSVRTRVRYWRINSPASQL